MRVAAMLLLGAMMLVALLLVILPQWGSSAELPNTELHVYGSGDYVEKLTELVRERENVKYLGVAPNSEIVKAEVAATLLINPRPSHEDYTKYSFPSKTMEYLATGVPVVMNRLPGIPKEYEEHIFYTENSTAKALAEAITNVLNIDDNILLNHGRKAAAFIFENKNSEAQAKKTVELIDKL